MSDSKPRKILRKQSLNISSISKTILQNILCIGGFIKMSLIK